MNWKIEGLKRFDSIFGKFACLVSKFIVSPRTEISDNPSILVIRPGGIGDAVLLYPALGKLREHFPDSRIDILAEKRNAGVLKDCGYIDNLYLYDRNPPFELFSALRGKYDIVIDTEQWHRLSSVIGYWTRAPIRAGFDTNERSGLLSHTVPYSHDDYEAESFLRLVEAVTEKDYEFDKESPFLNFSSTDVGSFAEAIQTIRDSGRAVAGIFTGATVKERRWGAHNFAAVAGELSAEGVGIVLVGGAAEASDADEFNLGAGEGRILNLIGKTSLSQTAAIISELDILITSDTGILHIAYGVGTPTVSLFGAGIQKKWAPAGGKHAVINKGYSCSPCTKFGYTPACPYDVKCLGDISVDEVKVTALNLLRKIKG